MKITTRAATDLDREACLWVEDGAMPGYGYLNDAWNLFLHQTDGDLTCALADDKIAGIGKLTRLYNSYGWLETLRVHPDYQGKGLGKAIYKRYLEEMKELKLTAIGMYTGTSNLVSKGLAELNGLHVQEQFTEFIRPVSANGISDLDRFSPVSEEKSEDFLPAVLEEMGKFVCVNRTFYPVKPGLLTHFAKEGYLYSDKEGNFIIIGARFQPQKSQHIACMCGDKEKLLQFANELAVKREAKNLTCVYPYSQKDNREYLLKKGFQITTEELITQWLGLV